MVAANSNQSRTIKYCPDPEMARVLVCARLKTMSSTVSVILVTPELVGSGTG